jgi:hypothetical protein
MQGQVRSPSLPAPSEPRSPAAEAAGPWEPRSTAVLARRSLSQLVFPPAGLARRIPPLPVFPPVGLKASCPVPASSAASPARDRQGRSWSNRARSRPVPPRTLRPGRGSGPDKGRPGQCGAHTSRDSPSAGRTRPGSPGERPTANDDGIVRTFDKIVRFAPIPEVFSTGRDDRRVQRGSHRRLPPRDGSTRTDRLGQ